MRRRGGGWNVQKGQRRGFCGRIFTGVARSLAQGVQGAVCISTGLHGRGIAALAVKAETPERPVSV